MHKPVIVRNGLIALIVVAFAGLALAQIGGVLGGSREPSSLARILPARITMLAGAEKRADGANDPWRLFDGDTERGFASGGPGAARLRLVLDGPHTLAAVGAFGPANGRLTVWAEQEGVPVALLDLEPRAGGWSRAAVAQPFATRALLVDWQPASPGEALPEIELWGTEAADAADAAGQEEPGGSGIALGSPAAQSIAAGSAGRFQVRLAGNPATASRAFLSYELTGLSHWSAAVRSINGLTPRGWSAAPAAEPSLQTEEIDPAWLRPGINEIQFAPAHAGEMPEEMAGERSAAALSKAGESVPYEVRNLRLVLVGEPGRMASALSWEGTSPLALALARPAQPYGLEITLAQGTRGVLSAVARLAGGGAMPLGAPVDLGVLGAGRHLLPVLAGLPAATAVELSWSAPEGGKRGKIEGVALLASPVGRRQGPRLELTHPPAGDAAEEGAYLRGFVNGPAGVAGLPELFVNGAGVRGAVAADGSLGALIPRPTGEEGVWDLALELLWPDGTRLTRALRLGQGGDEPGGYDAHRGETGKEASPEKSLSLSAKGARLEVPAGAVGAKVKLTMKPLAADELPPLDAGMTNVTPGRGGFRLGPHGQKFRKPVQLTLPFDQALIPAGMRPEDVRTYYFDEAAGRWIAVPRLKLGGGSSVVSATDHFTDFINATLTLPEEPAGSNFSPNSLQELAKANPASEIELMAAPEGGPRGDATLRYPLMLPAGRLGLQPELALSYNSGAGTGGNSWLGVGWDLRLPSIEISTLFGVPQYHPALETETYSLEGEQLAPVAIPASPAPRQAERVFTRRMEGSFQRIVRHGGGPAGYWWEVTDQNGVRSIFGQTAQARLADPQTGNVFQWFLERVVDLHGNTVDYSYSQDADNGSGEPWVQVYPAAIAYTGVQGSGAFYQVRFFLDDGQQRPDRFSSGRSGFKVVTRRRLAQVDVMAGPDLVRRYLFQYQEGEFRKSLLASLAVTGEDGTTVLASHQLTYQHAEAAFGPMEAWGGVSSTQDVADSVNVGGSVHGYVGLGPPICMPLVGIQVGGSLSTTNQLLSFLDVNGDGLPDRLRSDGSVELNRQGAFQSASMSGITSLGSSLEFGFDVSGGVRLDLLGLLPVSAGGSFAYSHANEYATLVDINGDGYPDEVTAAGGFQTRLNDGSAFQSSSNWGGFGAGGLSLARPGEESEVLAKLKLADTVRRLVLPFAGPVTLDGAIQKKQTGGDGVKVSIYRNGSRIWQRTFAADDTAACVPADGDGCGSGGAGGLSFTAQAGDRLYFLADSIRDTDNDALLWAPRATYTGQDATALEPWGSSVYSFDGGSDFRLAGLPGVSYVATEDGTAQVAGPFVKQATSDDVTVSVLKNGDMVSPVYQRTFAAAETGSFDDIPPIAVAKTDRLTFQVSSGTPVDPDLLPWAPQVTLGSNQPQAIQPLYTVPRLDPADQPTQSWPVPSGWDQSLHFTWTPGSGTSTLYVQGVNRLIDRRDLAGAASFDVTGIQANAGEPLFVTVLGSGGGSPGLLTVTGNGGAVPVNTRSIAAPVTEALSGGWHGWSYGEWNGNKPFTEGGLSLPQSQNDALPDFTPAIAKTEGVAGFAQPSWTGAAPDLYQAAEGVKPGRQGGNAAGNLDQTSATTAGGGLGVLRVTTGRTGGLEVSAGISLTVSLGDSESELDLVDMNGDRYPDQVSSGGVRFSNGRNGFGDQQPFPGLNSSVRRSEDANVSTSIGFGFPYTKKDASGEPNGVVTTMPTVGDTVGLSTARYDLVDVNGDGLPDRVAMNSGGTAVTVQLNLGYRFGQPELWPLPAWQSGGGPGSCTDLVDVIGNGISSLIVDRNSPDALSYTRSSALHAGVAIGPFGVSVSSSLSRTLVHLVDVNGDGLPDHVSKEQDEDFFRVKLNHGDGWDPEQRWPVPAWTTQLGTTYVIPGVNRCLDAVTYTGNIGANASLGFQYCQPLIPPVVVAGLELEISGQIQGNGGGLQLSFEDLDGDGLPDHVLKKPFDSNVYVKRNLAEQANLLTGVQRPLNGSLQLSYARQGNRVGPSGDGLRKVDMPDTQWVLAAVTEDDGRGNSYTTRYDYFNEAFHDRAERESYGYSRVKTTRPDGSTIDRHFKNQDFYQRNLLESEQIADAAGHVFRARTLAYDLRPLGSAASFPALTSERTDFSEGTGSVHKSTATTYDYDSFGNVIAYNDSGDQGAADDLAATAAYAVDPEAYVVKPSQLVVRDGGGRLLRQRQATYNAQGDLVRMEQVLVGGKDPATGTPYTGNSNAVWTYAYDAVGNLASSVDPSGFTATYAYEPVARILPAQVTDSFGYVTRFTWDLKRGDLLTTVDKNGQTIRRSYDGFGRLVRVVGPTDSDASPALALEYDPVSNPARAIVHQKDVTRSVPIDSALFIDGLGRTVQSKESGELDLGTGTSTRTGMRVSGRIEFDALGRTAVQGQPVFDTGAPGAFVNVPSVNPTRMTYDVLDRVVQASFPQGAVTGMSYGFGTLDGVEYLAHTRTDANGRATIFYDDVQGSVIGVQQTNTIAGAQRTLITRYAYDALQQLTAVTDPKGNVTQLENDTLGHRVAITSPDSGRTEMRYTPAGDLGAKVTANLAALGQQIRYQRSFHRLDRIVYPAMPAVVYTYGGPGAPGNTADRIASVTNESGVEQRTYDRLGNLAQSVRTLTALNGTTPRGPFTTSFQHDGFGRLLSLVYPDGEQVTWGFDAGGDVKTASGVLSGVGFQYLRHQGYDEFGQKVRTVYGNGVETRWTYDAQSRELAGIHAQDSGGKPFQNLSYRRDLTGTMLSLQNNVPAGKPSQLTGPANETFVYDDIYQLVGATGSARQAPNKTASFTLTLAYDEAGNLVTKNQGLTTKAKPQTTSYNWTYTYGGAHPHAPVHLGDRTLHYDLDGNQTGWDHDTNGTRRTNTWDEEDRLKAVADNGQTTRFLYDSDGLRTAKAGQGGETLYVNKWFSLTNGNTASKHVFADGDRIVTKTGPSGNPHPAEKIFFYQADHLGSTQFITDDQGAVWQHLEYFPQGEVWVDERSQSDPTLYLFSGKELDEETGLSYFGARYYDGRQGQWESADPVYDEMLDTADLARPDLTFHAFHAAGLIYGYVSNDPQDRVDPNGLGPTPANPPANSAAAASAAASSTTPGVAAGKVKKPLSARMAAMGATPGKHSATGKKVLARMKAAGDVQDIQVPAPTAANPAATKTQTQVNVPTTLGGPKVWKDLDEKIHMGHIKDAVTEWNNTFHQYGARSKQVRTFMRDDSNYEFEWGPLNSSNGSKLGTTYVKPAGWTAAWPPQ